MIYTRGGQTFWITGQISRKNSVADSKKINETKFMLLFAKKEANFTCLLTKSCPETQKCLNKVFYKGRKKSLAGLTLATSALYVSNTIKFYLFNSTLLQGLGVRVFLINKRPHSLFLAVKGIKYKQNLSPQTNVQDLNFLLS